MDAQISITERAELAGRAGRRQNAEYIAYGHALATQSDQSNQSKLDRLLSLSFFLQLNQTKYCPHRASSFLIILSPLPPTLGPEVNENRRYEMCCDVRDVKWHMTLGENASLWHGVRSGVFEGMEVYCTVLSRLFDGPPPCLVADVSFSFLRTVTAHVC